MLTVPYQYGDGGTVTTESSVSVADSQRTVSLGRELIASFEAHGVEDHPRTDKAFSAFHEALYGAGLVMTDFDGLTFSNGPHQLIEDATAAPVVAQAANLLTVRMFFHTLARGYHWTDNGSGYSYFDAAFKSGGLLGLINRLEELCECAEKRGDRDVE
jgi:hypothetical protein